MADFVFNIAKGRVHQLARNVEDGSPANARLVAVPIEAAGIEADATLKDYDTLAALLAAANNEQVTMGRKEIAAANITISVDDVNERVDIDIDDLVWTGAAGNAIAAIVICYDPDNAAGTDADLIPLTKHDFAITPDGSNVTAQVNAAGLYRAA